MQQQTKLNIASLKATTEHAIKQGWVIPPKPKVAVVEFTAAGVPRKISRRPELAGLRKTNPREYHRLAAKMWRQEKV